MPGLPARLKPSASPPSNTSSTSPTQDNHIQTRPSPRHHSPTSLSRIRIKNRRKHYLDTHPEYLSSLSLELADPLSYDRLIRRFQTPHEREAEGKKKGYSGILEADLWRSEAKISALSPNRENENKNGERTEYRRDPVTGEVFPEEKDEVPGSKEEGLERWREMMERRFLRGEDEDFEYGSVDEEEGWDGDEEQRDREEEWFEGEEESGGVDGRGGGLEGETGVQDF